MDKSGWKDSEEDKECCGCRKRGIQNSHQRKFLEAIASMKDPASRLRKARGWRLSDSLTNRDRSGKIYSGIYREEKLMPGGRKIRSEKGEKRSYLVYSKQAAVSRGRIAAYRRRRCTSWKILEGSTNFCLLFCFCLPSPCCSCTEDEHPPGRPVESVTQEHMDKIHDLVMLDRRMTVRRIEETLGILKITVDRIMREHLGLRKLSDR
ncbi:hypothetical protein LAZ67_2002687 [Cordylochernes scorpioides]|uniref:Uncharacterized protein n=1 Tax=Cordylochernes scorpioides TaxID=51811 RepID=A0ABY6K2E4_9ARAC|nr:hypothetical protein LAZ67_2002687 [Cordylochernes scorpioides]